MCKKIVSLNFKKSFSIIEIAISLSVIGLLSVASLSGISVMQQSRANVIIQQYQTYHKAINDFYKTYNYLPGDLPDAQYRFAPKGYTTATPAQITALNTNIRDTIPIDGEGKGYIQQCWRAFGSSSTTDGLSLWSMLGASGFINERYSSFCKKNGTAVPKINECIEAGYNMPAVKYGFKDAVWNFMSMYRTPEANEAFLGSLKSSSNLYYSSALEIVVFDHESAYRKGQMECPDYNSFMPSPRGGISNKLLKIIDTKMDDGKPLTGNVLGSNSTKKNVCYMGGQNCAVEEKQCVNIPSGKPINYKLSTTELSENNFKDINKYTNQKSARCIGLFVMSEFK